MHDNQYLKSISHDVTQKKMKWKDRFSKLEYQNSCSAGGFHFKVIRDLVLHKTAFFFDFIFNSLTAKMPGEQKWKVSQYCKYECKYKNCFSKCRKWEGEGRCYSQYIWYISCMAYISFTYRACQQTLYFYWY